MEGKSLGIYIHMPFCAQKCSYCSFVSSVYSEGNMRGYINALINEIKTTAVNYKGREIDTIYIGGGTPSMLFLGAITYVLETIKKHFKVSEKAEITIEGNPNSLTIAKLREYKNAGVNRLSVGFQAYSNKVLKLLNRPHVRKDFVRAIKNAKLVGFNNISADLLLGTPKMSKISVKMALNLIMRLKLNHVSCYGLILEEGTPIYKQIKEGKLKEPRENLSNECYNLVLKTLTKKGFYRYEVSNFSIKNHESQHNLKYWNLDDYLGFGVSSHSFVDGVRYNNFDDFKSYVNYYLNFVDDGAQIILPTPKRFNEKVLTKEDSRDEFIMLSLRKSEGLNLHKFEERFCENLLKTKQKEIEELKTLNLIQISDGFIRATTKGFEVLNQIILALV